MFRREPRRRRWLRLGGDLAVAAGVFFAAFQIRMRLAVPFTDSLLPPDRLEFFREYWPLVVVAQAAVLYFFGLYDPPHPRTWVDVARRLAPATLLQGLALGAFFFLAERTFPRSVLVLYVALDFAVILPWRLATVWGHVSSTVRVAIVGTGPAAVELASRVREHPVHGVAVAGWVAAPDEPPADAEPRPPVLGPCLGTLDDLAGHIASGTVDEIVIAETDSGWKTGLLDRLARTPDRTRATVLVLPGPFESLIGRMRYRWARDLPLIEVIRDSEWRLFRPVKRAFDLVAGTLLLILATPLMLACAPLVRLTSPGPVLFRQRRMGRGLRPFVLFKLRTMRVDAEAEAREALARPDDPRLTPIGGWLRRFRIDELPQLFNVLRGSMSLVGPRPERPGFVSSYLDDIPGYAERFSVPPGLTGLAQINGEYHSSAQNKLRYDLAYIANWSLWLDLSILIRTIKIVLTSRGV
jgi:exopolysaccharide biosynthesis polyprenyl glycosylphosphotransferase